MSRLEALPPDLHAALALLLSRRRAYAEIAAALGVEERAVHDRAHAALAMLAPGRTRELTGAQRERVGEYLLGQADPTGRREALADLRSSAPARAWAQALAAELAPLASEPLPEIPAGAAGESEPPREIPAGEPVTVSAQADRSAAGPEPQAATAAAPSSRRGGMIVLGAIAAVVIVAVALIVGVGGGSSHSHATGAAGSAAATSSSTSTTAASSSTSTTTAAGEPRVDGTIPLTPPNPAAGRALGVVEVLSRGSLLAFLVVAEHLPPTSGFRYAAWLYNSPTNALLLGSGPQVGANGTLKAAGALPANASSYGRIVLTEERSGKPSRPGPIVLSGAFKTG